MASKRSAARAPWSPRRSRGHAALIAVLGLLLALLAGKPASAEPPPPFGAGTCDPFGAGGCGPGAAAAHPEPALPQTQLRPLVFYWGVGCPHCEEAGPFVQTLEQQGPTSVVERVEVRQSSAGRERFLAEVKRLGITAPGIPLFVRGDHYVIGFQKGATEERVRAMLLAPDSAAPGDAAAELGSVDLPLFGKIDARALPLPALTLVIGLVDGINPCAMYVLVAMLGLLLHVRSRSRLLLFGGTFVVMSGVVYFLFMTAWLNIFLLTGLSRWVTLALGAALFGMGLVNLKELVWFKKGPSLMISDKAKPGLFRRMRAVAGAATLPLALAGIATLAFFVNLIELGCTLGLPAVYTRILSLRGDLSPGLRYLYLALYNVAYVVPLATIVIVYALTLHRFTLTERGAKVLKGVSGALLVLFGVIFLLAPQLLQ